MLDRKDLLPYQNHSVQFSKDHPNCAKWVDMGLGKTVVELTAFDDLLHDFEAKRMLVIGPKRVARRV